MLRWSRDTTNTLLRGSGGTDGGDNGGSSDEVHGVLRFENTAQTNGKTKLTWDVLGLDHQAPWHTWHVHAFGDLSGGNDGGKVQLCCCCCYVYWFY